MDAHTLTPQHVATGGPAWLVALTRLAAQGEAAVLVSVMAARGHTPREAGARMVVSRTGSWGSVGGGNLEATAVERARTLIRAGTQAPETLTLRLTDRAANGHGRQCCGGEVTLHLDPVLHAQPQVAVFGAGHVGLELARLLARHPIGLHLIDSRAAQLTPERLAPLRDAEAQVTAHHAPIPELVLDGLPLSTHILILTHDHAEDAAILDAALRRPGTGFLGLIGSSAKWTRFQAQLRDLGHPPDALARVTSPIGLPDLNTGPARKHPAVIALSVAAQLLPHLTLQPDPVPAPERTS
ncbi:xanthine dehydrogenase accessory protein XdhC [Deinococcus radiotolerans]|uniref:Xanthine dehydrogenase accessory protein XdhC n=1 Tax=Deinococcus radiotolerans TaxID=1309407 RepID=A0ABQ2FL74_9DEIO|nr:xanthine dehydrogenase accessory protein XdhC [Deinococcus radiotolerans]GGK99015.1 xanthine dehydrogenase accessory protein XdhC [Deinococcus radiotolerans]